VCGRCFNLQKAEFEEFIILRVGNRARFGDDCMSGSDGRFRDRHWPVFWRIRPRRQKAHRAWSPCAAKWDRSMEKAFRVKVQRRWLPSTPLRRQWDRIDEAIEATRGTRA
jgi:hypothetical protein